MIFVPGFGQTAASWSGVLAMLPLRTDAAVVDIPEAPTFTATADALAESGGPGLWVGYSMGGRLALSVALRHPERVHALVLASATAGLETDTERHARVLADEQRAIDVELRGVDAFLDDWLQQPMFANVPPNAPGSTERRTLSPATLAHQLRALGPGRMPSYWEDLSRIRVPVLVMTGIHDAKFDAIGAAMVQRIPDASHVRLDAGHALAQEQPAAVAEAITSFAHEVSA